MPADTTEPVVTRRGALRGLAGAAAAVPAASAVGTAGAQASSEPEYGGWFDGVSNYDGTVDRTGQEEVTVTVGASGNDGPFAFGPAAVHVDPGTTVVWEWTGEGGRHNVAAEDGGFESDLTEEAGFTFEQPFEDPGIAKYVCVPHEQMGMKGAVAVGDVSAASSGLSRTDRLALGSGLGLAAGLFALFALGARSGRERDADR
jgi:halocyanin-like protein